VQVLVSSSFLKILTTITASTSLNAIQVILDFDHCTFQDHVASYVGGALYLRGYGGPSRLTNCVFRNNMAIHVSTYCMLYE
jgi:hypothetical protein